jgi:hypothetical protein
MVTSGSERISLDYPIIFKPLEQAPIKIKRGRVTLMLWYGFKSKCVCSPSYLLKQLNLLVIIFGLFLMTHLIENSESNEADYTAQWVVWSWRSW